MSKNAYVVWRDLMQTYTADQIYQACVCFFTDDVTPMAVDHVHEQNVRVSMAIRKTKKIAIPLTTLFDNYLYNVLVAHTEYSKRKRKAERLLAKLEKRINEIKYHWGI
jgi:hypothetical protein